jgi:hypothetical protein
MFVLLSGGGSRNSSRDPSQRDLKVLAILGASGTGLLNTFDGDSEGADNSNSSPVVIIVRPDEENDADPTGHQLDAIQTVSILFLQLYMLLYLTTLLHYFMHYVFFKL